MIAIIIASGQAPEMHGLDDHLPMALFPHGDRPILHHIVDFLTSQGIRRFEFVLDHLPEKFESFLGDGTRWGCSFGFHLLPSGTEVFQWIETIAPETGDSVVVGRGDRLPSMDLTTDAGSTIFMTKDGDWTGWATMAAGSNLFPRLTRYASGGSPASESAFREVTALQEASFQSAVRLLESQSALLAGTFTSSTIGGREREPGIWISRNVSIHPTAKLQAPLFIGPNCKIALGARIGPSAVISEGCIVDQHSSVANSLVAPGTYVGQGLELQDVIVDRNRLVNATIGTVCLISESFLISGLSRRKKPRLLQRLVSSLGAAGLLTLTSPLAVLTLIYLLLVRRGQLERKRATNLPASNDARTWKEYTYRFISCHSGSATTWWTEFVTQVWPGLISVLVGDMFMVGVRPRSKQEIERLPSDWRSVYLTSKGGLITEASVMFGRSPTEDELYTAEAYYSATESLSHDLKLLGLYVRRFILNDERSVADFGADPSMQQSLENVPERR